MIQLRFAEIRPPESDVLRRLGVPGNVVPAPRVRDLLERAASMTEEMAEGRGALRRVEAHAFERVHEGEGRNAPESPLLSIVPRAGSLALFVATIGPRIEEQVARLMPGDAAIATILDAFASSAVSRAVDALAVRFADGCGVGEWRVLPYSPGYCGWHLSGQRALFAAMGAETAGVSLSASCLMTPVKSVSGVLVAGVPSAHRFRPDYPFCEECETHECIPRMASVRR